MYIYCQALFPKKNAQQNVRKENPQQKFQIDGIQLVDFFLMTLQLQQLPVELCASCRRGVEGILEKRKFLRS